MMPAAFFFALILLLAVAMTFGVALQKSEGYEPDTKKKAANDQAVALLMVATLFLSAVLSAIAFNL